MEFIQGFPFELYGELYVAHPANGRQSYIMLVDVSESMAVAMEAQRRRTGEGDGIADKLMMITANTI